MGASRERNTLLRSNVDSMVVALADVIAIAVVNYCYRLPDNHRYKHLPLPLLLFIVAVVGCDGCPLRELLLVWLPLLLFVLMLPLRVGDRWSARS